LRDSKQLRIAMKEKEEDEALIDFIAGLGFPKEKVEDLSISNLNAIMEALTAKKK
jgi:hypothetical protein